MLCYVTPREHLGLPKREDVKQGCVAYRIAAHAADVALGIPGSRDWDDEVTQARAALNWNRHIELAFDSERARALHDEDLKVDTDYCAMCGHDWCSVRLSRSIAEFASGKTDPHRRGPADPATEFGPSPSELVDRRPRQQPDLQQPGTTQVASDRHKPACHSDHAAAEQARRIQQARLRDRSG